MAPAQVLIVDNDQDLRQELGGALDQEFAVHVTDDVGVALELCVNQHPGVVILELGLPPTPGTPDVGLKLLEAIREHGCSTRVIIHSRFSNKICARKVLHLGVYDIVEKPAPRYLLRALVKRAHVLWELEQENRRLPSSEGDGIEEILGVSGCMRRVFTTIQKVAHTDLPVLITGESGTGKELAARAIHDRSPRKAAPFVPINCSAIPETLLESELFGYERGAFTGATKRKEGKVEAAQGGTLFLDEIGDAPLTIQAKLLRFLQDKTIERVGGRDPIKLDVRIIAATNRDLEQSVRSGEFREDLFYRLGVVHIHLPPLREREQDVILIATALLKQLSKEHGHGTHAFTPEALAAVQNYAWPGNVRELANKIGRAIVMAEGALVTPQDLDLRNPSPEPEIQPEILHSLQHARHRVEDKLVIQALVRHQGNLSRAAKELGISRPTLYRLIEKHGLTHDAQAMRESLRAS